MFMAVPSLYTEASNVIILLLLWSWQIFIGWFLHKGLSFQFLLRKKIYFSNLITITNIELKITLTIIFLRKTVELEEARHTPKTTEGLGFHSALIQSKTYVPSAKSFCTHFI